MFLLFLLRVNEFVEFIMRVLDDEMMLVLVYGEKLEERTHYLQVLIMRLLQFLNVLQAILFFSWLMRNIPS